MLAVCCFCYDTYDLIMSHQPGVGRSRNDVCSCIFVWFTFTEKRVYETLLVCPWMTNQPRMI